MTKKVFISYRNDAEGGRHKNLLVAWSKNDSFLDFKFNDLSIGTSINSTNANYIKSVIKRKISECDTVLCLVGENTADSDWVNWELEKAVELNKQILAVKINNSYNSPEKLKSIGADWVRSFTLASIKEKMR